MDKFSEAELKGRNIIETKIKGKVYYSFTPTRFDAVDLVTSKDGVTSAATEIKYRTNYSSNDKIIQDEGVVLEKKKYDRIFEAIKTSGITDCFYYHIFNDNIGYVWKLNNLKEIQWVEEEDKYPKTTAIKGNKVTKTVTYLPLKTAIKVNLNQ